MSENARILGQILGDRYETRKQLGRKPGRQTWLAQDLHTQEPVVIKLLSFDKDFEWDGLKLFEREAEALQSLSHPAIPRYLDYLELDFPNCNGFALVQSYINAKSLEQHLKAGRSFSEAELRELAKALLEVLGYLHSQNPPVIHRDVKPSNILLGDRSGNSIGQVYLVDFGSVQTLAAQEGGTITVVGTYGYMPPEQFGGRAVRASDFYSLGATLIYLATGQHPADLPQKDLRIQFEPTADLSPYFSQWLRWMTEPSLENRASSTQSALDALETQRLPTGARAISPPAQTPFTRIKLRKTPKSLEVIFTPTISPIRVGVLLIGLGGALMLLTVVHGLEWGFLIYMISAESISSLLRSGVYTRLHITAQQISFITKFLWFEYEAQDTLKRQEVTAIERQGFSRIQISGQENNITLDCQQYYLTKSEADWLIDEVSRYLNVPIAETDPIQQKRERWRTIQQLSQHAKKQRHSKGFLRFSRLSQKQHSKE